jgi:hypothetical protein
MSLLTLSLKPVLKLTEGQFARLCSVNPDLATGASKIWKQWHGIMG